MKTFRRDRALPFAAVLLGLALATELALAAPGSCGGPPDASSPLPRGAKELFYDPNGGTAATAQPHPAPSAPPAAPPAAPASTRAEITKAATVASRPPARRQLSVPSKAAGRAEPKAVGLSYWIELVDAKGGPGRQVTGSYIFHSGDAIRLHFRSNGDGEVTLIQLGASGASTVLFPDPAKGLLEGRLLADEERILPSEAARFRFDETPGTEKLLVLFARRKEDLERFPVLPAMDVRATTALVRSTQTLRGSKDLFVETENRAPAEIGTYGVNVAGQPVVLEIDLTHR